MNKNMNDFPHDYLYHATFLHNLDGIAARGLTRSGGSQFNEGYSAHSQGRVFLSEWDAVSYWMSKMEDIANAMLYLTSPASSWVSGQIINVHGGGHVTRLFG